MKLYTLLFTGWSVISACSAQAAFFTDEEAHNQIRQLKVRVLNLEGKALQQAQDIKKQFETHRQYLREILDLQAQIEAQDIELRRLRGQDELLTHSLQDAKMERRGFYDDLDNRVKRLDKQKAVTLPKRSRHEIPDDPSLK